MSPRPRKLYTLSEVSKIEKISMPTLQRYKKLYQDRIPSQGEGRRQRYPREALAVFRALKQENLARRGRPKRTAVKKRRSKTSKPGGKRDEDLLPLSKISQLTGISYPTLQRYVRLFGERIPSDGKGRKRRYHPAAVEVFRKLRRESTPGRKKKVPTAAARSVTSRSSSNDARLSRKLERLEKSQVDLKKKLDQLERLLKKPIVVTLQR